MTNCITKCNHRVKLILSPFQQVGDVKVFNTYLGVKIALFIPLFTPHSSMTYVNERLLELMSTNKHDDV